MGLLHNQNQNRTACRIVCIHRIDLFVLNWWAFDAVRWCRRNNNNSYTIIYKNEIGDLVWSENFVTANKMDGPQCLQNFPIIASITDFSSDPVSEYFALYIVISKPCCTVRNARVHSIKFNGPVFSVKFTTCAHSLLHAAFHIHICISIYVFTSYNLNYSSEYWTHSRLLCVSTTQKSKVCA